MYWSIRHLPEITAFSPTDQKLVGRAARSQMIVACSMKEWLLTIAGFTPMWFLVLIAHRLQESFLLLLTIMLLAIAASSILVHLLVLNFVLQSHIRKIVNDPEALNSVLNRNGAKEA